MSYWNLQQRSNCKSKIQRNNCRLYLTYSKYDLYRQKTATWASHSQNLVLQEYRRCMITVSPTNSPRSSGGGGGVTGGIAGVSVQKVSVRNLVLDMCGCGHGTCGDLLCEVMGNEDLVEAGHCCYVCSLVITRTST
jgi:hypothetical protein